MVLDVLRLCACCYDPFQRFKGSWLTSLYFSGLLQYGGLEPKWSLVLGPFGWSMYMLLLLYIYMHIYIYVHMYVYIYIHVYSMYTVNEICDRYKIKISICSI